MDHQIDSTPVQPGDTNLWDSSAIDSDNANLQPDDEDDDRHQHETHHRLYAPRRRRSSKKRVRSKTAASSCSSSLYNLATSFRHTTSQHQLPLTVKSASTVTYGRADDCVDLGLMMATSVTYPIDHLNSDEPFSSRDTIQDEDIDDLAIRGRESAADGNSNGSGWRRRRKNNVPAAETPDETDESTTTPATPADGNASAAAASMPSPPPTGFRLHLFALLDRIQNWRKCNCSSKSATTPNGGGADAPSHQCGMSSTDKLGSQTSTARYFRAFTFSGEVMGRFYSRL